MKKRLIWIAIIFLAVTTSVFSGIPIVAGGNSAFAFILDVEGDQVEIFRDDFGVPHISAETDRGLFVGFGYSVAEDRLWQLEANRRAARGQLAEIFGPDFLQADKAARTLGYTEYELNTMFDTLPPDVQVRFQSYVEGISRYITQVVLPDPYPYNNTPAEFVSLGITPTPWSVTDVVAFGAFRARNFGEIGGDELENQELLQYLITEFGVEEGNAIFNDVRWRNDPDAPVTVPTRGAAITPVRKGFKPGQLNGACVSPSNPLEDAKETWEELGIPTRFGSYGWVLSARRSKRVKAMLYGGPQMGFTTPSILLEVQLKGGESNFNVRGMTFAGAPSVLIGYNRHLAWTSTTGVGDNLDTYIETLCNAGGGVGSGYFFNGPCIPFQTRFENILIADPDQPSVTIPVLRSVHGPVIGLTDDFAFSQKRAHWMQEMETELGFGRLGEARNLTEFEAAVDLIVTSHNLLYADRAGNIAYWQAGEVPERPEGFDPRLPLPGIGTAEWPGGVLPTPKSINPARGWLANWNNKPSRDFDNADEDILGKQFRILDLTDRLARNRTRGQLSQADMEDIPKDIGRIKELGREARFLKPYLIKALEIVGTLHPSGEDAKAILEVWDGSAVADVITSKYFEAAEVIFSTWLETMITTTFADELGTMLDEAGTNMLLHVLDDALAKKGSGVPPGRDYFNGADPNQVIAATFDLTLAGLTKEFKTLNPTLWVLPRSTIDFQHPFLPINVGSIPLSNRATYGQIVIFGKKKVFAESIQPLGQSGFISLTDGLDVHFADQLDLFRNFEYKPMTLSTGP
ncbi:MAG: penicillin acylase family protein [Desulfobulbaceae bacterium]|nr:penicillin acylase family protein [Desulfobulbaceae bacterium]